MSQIGFISSAGSGDTVLWIHGYSLDSTIWQELWDLLPGCNHIGIDLPGHGTSGEIPSGEDLCGMADRMGRVALDRGARHVVGLSFGGTVALQVATQFPDAFQSLTLGAPGLGGGPQDPEAQARNIQLAALFRARGRGAWMTELWMQSPPDIFKGAAQHPALWERLRHVIDKHEWTELGDSRMNRLSNYRQAEVRLKQIRARTLVLIGDKDMGAFRRSAELIRRSIPGCRREYLPEAGHLCMLEQPGTAAVLLREHIAGARG